MTKPKSCHGTGKDLSFYTEEHHKAMGQQPEAKSELFPGTLDALDDLVAEAEHLSEANNNKENDMKKIKELEPCNAVEHTITDDGKACQCGYFVSARHMINQLEVLKTTL